MTILDVIKSDDLKAFQRSDLWREDLWDANILFENKAWNCLSFWISCNKDKYLSITLFNKVIQSGDMEAMDILLTKNDIVSYPFALHSAALSNSLPVVEKVWNSFAKNIQKELIEKGYTNQVLSSFLQSESVFAVDALRWALSVGEVYTYNFYMLMDMFSGTENDCILEEIPQLYFEAFLQSDPKGFDEYFLKFSEKIKEKMISLPPNPHAKAFSSYCQKRHLEQNLKTPATSAPTRKI